MADKNKIPQFVNTGDDFPVLGTDNIAILGDPTPLTDTEVAQLHRNTGFWNAVGDDLK